MADDPARKPKEQAKSIEQKGGERSDVSTTEVASPSKSMEEKGEENSGDSTAQLAGPSMMSEQLDKEFDLHIQRMFLKWLEQKGEKGSDESTTKIPSLDEWLEQKGEKGSDESTTKTPYLDEWLEQKGEIGSDESTTKIPSLDEWLEQRREKFSYDSTKEISSLAEKGWMGSYPSPTEDEISKTADQESSGCESTDSELRRLVGLSSKMADDPATELTEQAKKGGQGSDDSPTYLEFALPSKLIEQKGGKRSDSSPTELFSPSKELEGVLLHTQRLTVYYEHTCSHPAMLLGREGEKSGLDTVMRGEAGLKLHVFEWMSTGDETHLVLLSHAKQFQDVISILAPLCPAVKHISIDFRTIYLRGFTRVSMPMRSVITVCIKSLYGHGTLQETLLGVNYLFPNAESLDMQIGILNSPSDQAYSSEVNSSSTLRKLILRCTGRLSNVATTDSLFMEISTSCPNIVSLVLSGFQRWLSNKSGKFIGSCKLPNLTNIHLKPFGTDDCCRFEALPNVLHEVRVTSPHLRLVEAKKLQLGDAELTSVKWSQTSSGCELQLEGASAAVPMADLMHLVSNELEGVSVLIFDRCKVDFPQRISHLPQSTWEESSLRELTFLNVECPLSQTDIHTLSEMYPNVKVTVEHKSQASYKDSEQGTRMPFKAKRKTFPSSPPFPTSSIAALVEATARVQVHEEQTDTQNTEEEGKEEEEEDHMAMESLPHETDEVNVKPIKMECCKRVGVEGGTLQLDSFGIELEIPPGAIDSEAPQDISLSVLTDTPNLGNNKEEMSLCFGVQCLAPDDLVLKLPVTYTIPHCAVITRYSSVEAVLYTGEGEYSPDAVVKERIILTRSGVPSCTIRKDILQLKMNHFSWAKIKLRFKNFFFRGKKMCCWPFREKNLDLEKTPVILHAHLYDDIKGNSEYVKSQEEGYKFIPAVMERQVLIKAAEVDLKMTCYVKETVIGRPAVVSFEKLKSGTRICEPFALVFANQSNSVVVSLKVGQNKKLEVDLLFRLEADRTEEVSPQDQEQPQGASSSQTLQISNRSTGETVENISGRQEDFDDKLTTVARKVARRDEIDNLGKALGFEPEDIQRYVDTNMKNTEVSYMGTLSMLRAWRKKQTEATECEALKRVLRKAGQIHLAGELFGT